MIASTMAGFMAWLKLGRWRCMYDGPMMLLCDVIVACFWQCVVEYYWHRAMHLPFFYKRFHKIHHHFKSPEPFDDLYVHPLEVAGYYVILYSPAFVTSPSVAGYAAYMAIMGSCGVLDHCGVRIKVTNTQVRTTKKN